MEKPAGRRGQSPTHRGADLPPGASDRDLGRKHVCLVLQP